MPLANKALPKASLETDARSQLLRSARASKGLAEACTPLSPVSSETASKKLRWDFFENDPSSEVLPR